MTNCLLLIFALNGEPLQFCPPEWASGDGAHTVVVCNAMVQARVSRAFPGGIMWDGRSAVFSDSGDIIEGEQSILDAARAVRKAARKIGSDYNRLPVTNFPAGPQRQSVRDRDALIVDLAEQLRQLAHALARASSDEESAATPEDEP